ncbi:unnamed protein product, partial [Ectocarpus fasciculatus]
RGVLTPEEFVGAGDLLVHTCPPWAWSAGEPGQVKPYLPADKQCLITRGVPSYRRASDMNNDELMETAADGVGEDVGEDAWYLSDLVKTSTPGDIAAGGCRAVPSAPYRLTYTMCCTLAGVGEMSVGDSKPPAEEEIPDIDDLEDASLALDGDTLPATQSGGVLKARRYDVSISYDKYYQTPRIWLFGYDEEGNPLTPEKMFDDVISDYSNKTVTLDPHPHFSLPHASVHPCQHGVAMKRVVEELMSGGGAAPSTDQYLFIFLKFMQSVIPTIEFDNTVDVQM